MQGKLLQSQFRLQLSVAEKVVPARRVERIHPKSGAKELDARAKIVGSTRRFGRDRGVVAFARDVEPVDSGSIVVQKVVGPAELQSDRSIGGILLARGKIIAFGVFEEARLITSFAKKERIQLRIVRAPFFEQKRQLQGHTDVVGSDG